MLIDTDNPGVVTPLAIINADDTSTGLGGRDLVDIDVNPASGELVGVASEGFLYRLDPRNTYTLQRTFATLDTGATLLGTVQAVDFNPVADRLRVSSSADRNFRITPSQFNNPGLSVGTVTDDGTFAYTGTDANFGDDPGIIAVAYTNSVDAATSTQLFSLDTNADRLLLHSSDAINPTGNFSALNTVAALSFPNVGDDLGLEVGFDISGTTGLAVVSNNGDLFTLNLTTGQLTTLALGVDAALPGGFGTLESIAFVPEPASLALIALGALALRRQRQGRR